MCGMSSIVRDCRVVTGLKKGFLFKKKKVDNVWQSRFFTLEKTQLSYFRKITVRRHLHIHLTCYFISMHLTLCTRVLWVES